jgi:hypothetical protein
MRKAFTGKEIAKGPEKKIVAQLKPSDMAYLMRDIPVSCLGFSQTHILAGCRCID